MEHFVARINALLKCFLAFWTAHLSLSAVPKSHTIVQSWTQRIYRVSIDSRFVAAIKQNVTLAQNAWIRKSVFTPRKKLFLFESYACQILFQLEPSDKTRQFPQNKTNRRRFVNRVSIALFVPRVPGHSLGSETQVFLLKSEFYTHYSSQ